MTLNIYYYMYECFKLTSFPEKANMQNSVAISRSVLGRERERTQWDDSFFFCLFYFVAVFFLLDPDRGPGLGGDREACQIVQRRCGVCARGDTVKFPKQTQKDKVFKSMLEREKHCKNIFLRNVFFIRANILGCKCEDI